MRKSNIAVILHKVVFILTELLRHPRITREELNEKWMDDIRTDNIPFERKSFFRYRSYIEELFGVLIETSGEHDKYYHVANPEDLGSSRLYNWTMSALQMGDLLLASRSLHDRILLEDFPSENGRLVPILKAMHAGVYVSLEYRRYGSSTVKEHQVAPYCIKQYKRRLYMLGANGEGALIPFSLDRIESLTLTTQKFHLPYTFDSEAYFSNSFGIVVDNEKYPPGRVVLRATANEACYLKDVPMHQSQTVLAATDDYTDFCYSLSVTDDLIGYILSRADRLKVISPVSLAEEVRQRHLMAASIYD